MIDFYQYPLSGYSARVRAILDFKRVKYRLLTPPNGYGSKEYKKIVPSGTIPAIILEDGYLSESSAIGEYLEEFYPEPSLLPGGYYQRARCRMISAYHDTSLEPILRALFPEVAPSNRNIQKVNEKLDTFLEKAEIITSLGDFNSYAIGDSPSLADFTLFPSIILAEIMFKAFDRKLNWSNRLKKYSMFLDSDPHFLPSLGIVREQTESWAKQKLAG